MAGLLSAALILTGTATNLWLMVHLLGVVKLVSAIQAAWGRAEGMVEAIPWLPFFLLIPVAAIAGTIYMAEKYAKIKKTSGINGLLRFAIRVWLIQLLAFSAGEALTVIFLPPLRTTGLIVRLGVLIVAAIVLAKLPTSNWGRRMLSKGQTTP